MADMLGRRGGTARKYYSLSGHENRCAWPSMEVLFGNRLISGSAVSKVSRVFWLMSQQHFYERFFGSHSKLKSNAEVFYFSSRSHSFHRGPGLCRDRPRLAV